MSFRVFAFLLFLSTSLFAQSFHHEVKGVKGTQFQWEEKNVPPFDQLIVSWNGKKPTTGCWNVCVQLFQNNQWQPPLAYMQWAGENQGSCDLKAQDTIDVAKEKGATGFRVVVEATDKQTLQELYCLHAYARGTEEPSHAIADPKFFQLQVAPLSQIALQHDLSDRVCSPTSTLAAVRYLSNSSVSDPIAFAGSVYDKPCDLYGNWVLNVAGASDLLGPQYRVWVERKVSFQTIMSQLSKGFPTVVSVKGPLEGSALPYANGHLLLVRGYDPVEKRVLVMDPAFHLDQLTLTSYALQDFLEAWGRRGNTAYLFAAVDCT